MKHVHDGLVAELRREAIRARDEHGNTDFYALLRRAADALAAASPVPQAEDKGVGQDIRQFADCAWPTRGPDFNPWHDSVAAFAALIEANPGLWLRDMSLKYLELRIDTRDGRFIVFDRDHKRISPDRAEIAARAARESGSNLAYSYPQETKRASPPSPSRAQVLEEAKAACQKVTDDWREDAVGRVEKKEYANANTSNAHANGAEECVEAIRALQVQQGGEE